jgi:glycosyltransferase involved in cell wall biosynthesis
MAQHQQEHPAVELSAVILTFNEEKNIGRCLASLEGIADEMVVVDSFSTDRTAAICREHGARFVQHPFDGFIEQKTWAIAQAVHPFILCLDGDEALSDELRQSILKVKACWTHDAYFFNRLSNYCGAWIRHAGWYPDRKLRLWDRRRGRYGGMNPHEQVILQPGARRRFLTGELYHYAFDSISEHLQLVNKYSDIKAMGAFEKGQKASWIQLLFNPLVKFVRDYFLKLGFLDGFYGFVVSVIGAHSKFLKYAKLRELHRKRQA